MLHKKLNVFVARFTEALSDSASKCLLVTLLWFILVFNLWFQIYFKINSEKPRGDEPISTMYTRIDSMYVYLGELGSKTFSGVTCQMTQTITFDSTLFSVWMKNTFRLLVLSLKDWLCKYAALYSIENYWAVRRDNEKSPLQTDYPSERPMRL